jgi:hypothetical protein
VVAEEKPQISPLRFAPVEMTILLETRKELWCDWETADPSTSLGMTKGRLEAFIGCSCRIGKQQVPPLRFASVGMTILSTVLCTPAAKLPGCPASLQ